jgi:hypothetical protein
LNITVERLRFLAAFQLLQLAEYLFGIDFTQLRCLAMVAAEGLPVVTIFADAHGQYPGAGLGVVTGVTQIIPALSSE